MKNFDFETSRRLQIISKMIRPCMRVKIDFITEAEPDWLCWFIICRFFKYCMHFERKGSERTGHCILKYPVTCNTSFPLELLFHCAFVGEWSFLCWQLGKMSTRCQCMFPTDDPVSWPYMHPLSCVFDLHRNILIVVTSLFLCLKFFRLCSKLSYQWPFWMGPFSKLAEPCKVIYAVVSYISFMTNGLQRTAALWHALYRTAIFLAGIGQLSFPCCSFRIYLDVRPKVWTSQFEKTLWLCGMVCFCG